MKLWFRLPALIVGLLGLGSAALGLACLPPILGRWILAAGRVEPGLDQLLMYAASALFLGLAFVAGRMAIRLWTADGTVPPRKIQFAIVTVVLGGLVALAGAELFARLLLPVEKVLSGDAYHKHVWLSNKADAPREILNPVEVTDRYDPELGWTPKAGYSSEGMNINAQGLRGTREHPAVKPEGERRIVVTGDSFTFGENVTDAEVYTEVLDSMLEGVRVVNLAVHGYGTDQQYLRLRDLGFDFDPDLVVLAYYKTNGRRNELTFRAYGKPRFRLSEGRLQLENVPVPDPSDPRMTEFPPDPLSYLWALVVKNVRKAWEYTRFDPQWELTRAILDAILEDTQKRGVPFALMYIPASRPRLSRIPESSETILAEWARKRDVPFLNLRPVFLALPAEQRARLYKGHWTPEGHHVAAETLARWLTDEGLLRKGSSLVFGQSPRDRGD